MRYRKHALHPLTCWAGIAALLASITLSFPASAATYTVTNLNDSGAGSLRQAILDANATLGVADTIEFDPSVTGTITLTTGEIQITDKLTLNGPGEAVLTISGNQKSRIFNVKTMNTTMSSLTLKDGKVSSDGGAILNQGSLTLKQLTFTNNKADGYSSGGAIKNDGVLTMSDIIVTGSSATHDGGAFYNNGLATLNNGTFSGNLTTNGGGAILNTSSGKLTINRAVFDGNQSDYGGAINNSGILSLNESAFSANQAKNAGGAICSNGRLSVTNSLFAQNRSGTNGGGIATQEDTTIYNSTFSQNYAESSGGAICAYRYGYSPSLTLLNDTLTGNYAGAGGSVWFGGTLTIGNTISVGNFAPTNLEIYKSSGTFTSQGNNLFGSNTIFGGSDAASSGYSDLTIQSTDSILTEEPETVIGSLMDNGGFTQTHALIPGSPAIDAGGNSIVPTELTTD
jgi:predicted outer membrane repeat protein